MDLRCGAGSEGEHVKDVVGFSVKPIHPEILGFSFPFSAHNLGFNH